jgi:hypothetical protein
MKKSLQLLLASCLLSIAYRHCIAQELPRRDEGQVNYSAFDESFAPKMRILKGNTETHIAGASYLSPDQTSSMTVSKPESAGSDLWTIRVGIRSPYNSAVLELTSWEQGGFDVRWLNEKLIYGTVWWGRRLATNFIFDIERKDFLYREMAGYEELISPEPCKK